MKYDYTFNYEVCIFFYHDKNIQNGYNKENVTSEKEAKKSRYIGHNDAKYYKKRIQK